MFTSLGLFKDITCPEQASCTLPKCIFSHDPPTESKLSIEGETGKPARISRQEQLSAEENGAAGPRKKRKLDLDSELQGTRPAYENGSWNGSQANAELRVSTTRPVSPPPRKKDLLPNKKPVQIEGRSVVKKPPGGSQPALSLNPLTLAHPPASHAVRFQLTKMLHEHMSRLNDELKASNDPSKADISLSQEQLVALALEEEARAAKSNPSVYENVVKLRIVKLKKMKLADWTTERRKEVEKHAPVPQLEPANASTPEQQSDLTVEQEIALLPRLVANQAGLDRHGYVIKPPDTAQIEEARKGVEAAQGWEQCDRCQSRFQVFPDRREEDGALASGGKCRYHPAKPRRKQLTNESGQAPSRELFYACCHESVGISSGCTIGPTHVFKITDPKRLALILPFASVSPGTATPESSDPTPKTAVCFDCEMGYTTNGLELIRLTATSWPSGDPLLDVLVRPLGEILDFNSRYSGVWPEDFTRAIPMYASKDRADTTDALPIVASPAAARSLLFTHLTLSTPLIGHAIDNDLNAARIIHPTIIDTVLLYPHPRGLPVRNGLKALMKRHLDRDIQMGDGAAGHDSKEDARAAGELVRLRVGEIWRKMKLDGWQVYDTDGGDSGSNGVRFVPPQSKAEAMRAQILQIKK